ncbi:MULTISPECIES: AsnC family transcriptional regulator [Sinorhizobium]|nr:AsnC family transcriptional regulator [Sinorhizobium meliloti]
MMPQVSASNTPDAQENRRSEDLDEKDLKLISLLRRNARAPIVALARHIGLSRSATQDRMARLEGSGAMAAIGSSRERPAPSCRPHILLPASRAAKRATKSRRG